MSSKAAENWPPSVDPAQYRLTCARFTTGIAVVTTFDENKHPHGMTVNSFTSVSLDPPLILVSIDLRNAILGHFISASWFGINILAEHQEQLSRVFSSASGDRFRGVNWSMGLTGVPLLDGVLGQFECSVVQTFEMGDHTVLVGQVHRAGYREGKPLVYFNSNYQSLQE